jgi:hypothetical protein
MNELTGYAIVGMTPSCGCHRGVDRFQRGLSAAADMRPACDSAQIPGNLFSTH